MYLHKSGRQIFSVVWVERIRNVAGFETVSSLGSSQLAFKVCCRKMNNLCESLEFISVRLGPEQEAEEKENH